MHESTQVVNVEVIIASSHRHEVTEFNRRDAALMHVAQARSDRPDETITMITTEVFE